MIWIFAVILSATLLFAQPVEITGERLRAHIRFLSSDLLEGRAVGTRGGQLTTEYLASAFEAAGARVWLQRVPLAGVLIHGDASSLTLGSQTFAWGKDFIASTHTQESQIRLNAPVVFVGHGIRAPEFGWDDYAGVDVKGKVVLLFTGEPPSDDPAFFAGKALTYYGRWTYKFEEAARQGAAGALILHTDTTASYGWSVVENSFAREDIQLERDPAVPALRLAAWISSPAARRAGLNVEELLARADQKGFTPSALPQELSASIASTVRRIESHNVIGRIAGSDPTLDNEHIIYSAHWDHLGVGTSGGPDRIFNGAVDNATGCAMLIEMARAWASLEPRPRRTVLFIAVTGEESGLRGSDYYTRHPLLPLDQAIVDINIDGISPGGKPAGLIALGEDKSKKAWPFVEEAARRFELPLRPDPRPEAGSMFRSDHFSFLKAGVSAYSLFPADVPGDFAREYGAKHYHQPSDEYSPNWDMTSNEITARLAFTVGLSAASRP
jgi:Zn-dependent M28 family amino/carboxypeptidase